MLAALCLKMLMGPKAERRAKFPLRGKGGALAPKGVHFRERSEVCLFSSGRSPVVWFSLRCCHKHKLTPLPSIHSPITKWAGRWWRQPPKGGAADRQHFILAPTGAFIASAAILYNSQGGARNPSGRRQPIPDRTFGAQGQRPGGPINPRPQSGRGPSGIHFPAVKTLKYLILIHLHQPCPEGNVP